VDPSAVFFKKNFHRRLAAGIAFASLVATKDDTGGQALDIPLPGAAEGFVKIVDIEDDLCIGRGKEPEVSDMGITAKLDFDLVFLAVAKSAAIISAVPDRRRTASLPSG